MSNPLRSDPAAPVSNPYAAPQADLGPLQSFLPPEERSAVPQVFGILSICFSSLFILGMLGGLAIVIGAESRTRAPAEKVVEQPVKRSPSDPPDGAMALIGLSIAGGSIALLVIGIGQVRYRRWAGRASVVWGVAAPGLMVAGIAWAAVGTLEALGMLVPTLFFFVPYPLLLAIFFSRERVLASMR